MKHQGPIFALIDCNNFFVSCEKIFRPDLEGRPVVVLSSNDGCAVARSNEAKALGIPMAAPAFKYRDLLDPRPMHLPPHMRTPRSAGLDAVQGSNEERLSRTNSTVNEPRRQSDAAMYQEPGNAASFARRQRQATSGGVVQFSANFELYGDISKRITDLLTTITPRIEVYSVDESFLDLSELPITDYVAWGRAVREKIMQWVGVPVSIGIAPSKALAKLASDRGKKLPELQGVCSFVGKKAENHEKHMERMAVEDIWGIGRRLGSRLRAEGIMTAGQFASLNPKRAQQLIGIQGRQLVAELNGVSCWPLERVGKACKSIMSTRTFGSDTSEATVVEAAIASFAATAAFKLRRSRLLTTKAGVFLTTNKHKPGYQRWYQEVRFAMPTADTGLLSGTLIENLQTILQPHTRYHRAGVLLYDFIPEIPIQTDLFGSVKIPRHEAGQKRMAAVDALNQRFGKRTVRFAAEDLASSWQPKHQLRSPRYVSHWDELPLIRSRVW